MPRILLSIFLFLALANISCKKLSNSKEEEIEDVPEALAIHDNSTSGVYKGVIISASGTGTFKVVILNGDETAKIYVNYRGYKDTLTTTSVLTPGAELQSVKFVGKRTQINFSTDSDGRCGFSFFSFDQSIGETSISIAKEKSTQLVKYFIGHINGKNAANQQIGGQCCAICIVNRVSNKIVFWGLIYQNGQKFGNTIIGPVRDDGSVSGKNIDFKFAGTVKNKKASGTWTDDMWMASGTWEMREDYL